MKRSSSPENDDGPAPKRLTKKERERLDECKQLYKQADTSGKVVWSGTVKIHDKLVCDCSIKAPSQDAGIKSVFPQKQLTIHILPVSIWLSLHPYMYKIQSGSWLNLCTDENTEMMSYSAFSQAIRLGSHMRGCAVLKNTASALHLLCVSSFSFEHEAYIVGAIVTCQANDIVLRILRSHGLLPCGNPEHELAKLKEELQLKDKMLIQQLSLNQNLVKSHRNEMKEKELKHEGERNMMEEMIRDKERTIRTKDTEIENVLLEKKKLVANLYDEFQCSICHDTIIEAHYLPSCKHVFCKLCIEEWWKQKKTKCPYCRCKAGISIPYIGFDKFIDRVIGHFGKKAEEARSNAVKNRTAFIELKNELSFLLSSEELEGLYATSEGESMTSDGESVTSEGESVTSERESVTSEGESMISEEEEMVPEHSGRVSELYPPRERLTDSSDEES